MKSSKNKKEAEKRVSEIEYGKKKSKLSKQEIIPESKHKKIKREKDWVDDLSSDEMEFLVSIIQRYGGKTGGKYNGELDHDSIIMYGTADGSKIVKLIKSKLPSLSDIGKSQAESILVKLSDDYFYENMPKSAAKELAEYWGNKKMLWNKKEITMSKLELDELQKVQINIHKHHPEFDHFLTNQPVGK